MIFFFFKAADVHTPYKKCVRIGQKQTAMLYYVDDFLASLEVKEILIKIEDRCADAKVSQALD